MNRCWSSALALTAIFVLAIAPEAFAYDQYSNNGDDNCMACHGDFRSGSYVTPGDASGTSWGNLHNLHRNTMLGGDCDTCHSGMDRFPVLINFSDGGNGFPMISCMGCHGRVEDDASSGSGNPAPAGEGAGAGLRRHHYNANITITTPGGPVTTTVCANCHLDANPASGYMPVGENILPPYYFTPDSNHNNKPTDPCTNEDYAGNSDGIDNDGDGLYDMSDPDCGATTVCGDGTVDPGEDCDDSGESATCNADCTFASCGDGTLNMTAGEACDDGGNNSDTNPDACRTTCLLPTCGDSVIDTGEQCDDGGANSDTMADACRTTCVSPICGDGVADTGEDCDDSGESALCDADCSNAMCGDGTLNAMAGEECDDGGSNSDTAADACRTSCLAASCGDGVTDTGELCDAACPATCDDGNSCTTDMMTGTPATCDATCSNTTITMCTDSDSCCPMGCDNASDNDCSATCGNGVIDAGETCDPIATCPTMCDDGNACTTDTLTGSAASCSAACSTSAITMCVNADGCCPAGCDNASDDDCSASCGDGVLDPGETCDPPASCPTDCDDADACTVDSLTGSAANCNVACSNTAVVSCGNGDGCCPAGCDMTTDDDCSPLCGNGMLDPGETCDPQSSCPTTCDDGDACTTDSLSGSAAMCDALCDTVAITACADDDGCCAPGCDVETDNDCEEERGGCSCRLADRSGPSSGGLIVPMLLLGLWLGLRRRTRNARSS